MFTCPKLNQARAPLSNTVQEMQEFLKLSNKFVNFPGSQYGSIWMSVTDAMEEGVWRDHYTGVETNQDVLKTEVGGLKENTAQNCGVLS